MALKVGKHTTLTATLAQGATSATLTSAAFDNGTAVPLVLEYDSTSNIEVITADISGTALTNIVRAKDGTTDIAHTGTPKIGQTSHPEAYKYWIENDYSSSGKAWSAWTPVTYDRGNDTVISSTINDAYYNQVGKTVHVVAHISGIADPIDNNRLVIYITLPVTPKLPASNKIKNLGGGYADAGAGQFGAICNLASTSPRAYVYILNGTNGAAGAWAASGNEMIINLTYEAA